MGATAVIGAVLHNAATRQGTPRYVPSRFQEFFGSMRGCLVGGPPGGRWGCALALLPSSLVACHFDWGLTTARASCQPVTATRWLENKINIIVYSSRFLRLGTS